MSAAKHVTTGEVVFSNVAERDTYNKKPTKYGLVVRVDNAEAAKLEGLGVIVKEYTNDEGVTSFQRKFTTNYQIVPVDTSGQPIWVKDVDEPFELPRGTTVRLWWTGQPNEEHGLIPYMGGVRVLEMAEAEAPEEF